MKKLSIEDFDDYYREIHGEHQQPFPWQRRLMREVAEHGTWPKLLDLPTGTGKTTALDIAVFAQALDAERPVEQRWAPRRTVLVVDRRTVVDQAHERSLKLARRLMLARSHAGQRLPVLAAVAERLCLLAGEGALFDDESSPLGVHVLRGGMPRDDDWARSPTQPLIAVSTVDQVGSRLLFRGYGLSPRMQPVHAGLLANDVLFLLDEVHLARPFRDLLLALQQRYRGMTKANLPDRWQVVQMSATAGTQAVDSFSLDEEDLAHPVLAQRLAAKKTTALKVVSGSGSDEKWKRALAKAIAAEAEGRLAAGGAIGIVVNRVLTARMVFEELSKPVAAAGGALHLVTGRMRPVDREDLEIRLRHEFGSDRDRSAGGLRVVVATQCIEAGADFDFDVLLTECASLDALRQRFGRLDRLGKASGVGLDPEGHAGEPNASERTAGASASTKAVVFVRGDQVGEKSTEDPVYGNALRATWEYLSGLGAVDFGLEELRLPDERLLSTLLAPARQGPLLLPAHLDAWVQTSPAPYADPEPALWLHGSEQREPQVTLVWRADLSEEELREALSAQSDGGGARGGSTRERGPELARTRGRGDAADQLWENDAPDWLLPRLEGCPPRSLEALAVPLGACRSWLRKEPGSDATDAGTLPADEGEWREPGLGRPVVVWGRDQWKVVVPSRVAPGDLVVVPSSYGGLAEGSWAPEGADFEEPEPVLDVGDRVQLLQRGRAQLRLDVRALRAMLEDPKVQLAPLPNLRNSVDPEFDPIEALKLYLTAIPRERLKPWGRALRKVLTEGSKRELLLVDLGGVGRSDSAGSPSQPRYMVMHRRLLSRAALKSLFADASVSGSGGATDGESEVAQLPLIEATSAAEEGSLTGVEVTLDAHLWGVGSLARGYAAACGLPDALCAALEMAGNWHDLGKVDPRFQRWLHHGSAFRASVATELLAKSSLPSQDPAARETARMRAGYPKGSRHELMTLALLAAVPGFAERAGEHWELVLYLVGSHHGWCRPFAPFIADAEPVDVFLVQDGTTVEASSAHRLERLDSGIPERFWRLVRQYGWFGLAWLEALFRLADHRRSEAEVRLALAEKEGRDHAA